MTARKVLVAAVVLAGVVLLSSAALRWRFGVWSPHQPPGLVEYNDWRYGPAWRGDFEAMNASLASNGEPALGKDELVSSSDSELPPWWRLLVARSELDERYPEAVFVQTLDGSLHPYGYRGMPPSE